MYCGKHKFKGLSGHGVIAGARRGRGRTLSGALAGMVMMLAGSAAAAGVVGGGAEGMGSGGGGEGGDGGGGPVAPRAGCVCPDGTSAVPMTSIYLLDGPVTAASRPWRLSFPGGPGCVELSGTASVGVGSHAVVFARVLAGGINQEAAAAAPGVIVADWSPGPAGSSIAYLFVHVYPSGSGSACPMSFCIDAGLGTECCMPMNPSCPVSPSFTLQPLAGADCDGNLFDDRVDFLRGELTDLNLNSVADQCEGYVVPASLGFSYVPVGGTVVSTGPGGRVVLGDSSGPIDGGIVVDTAGFDSYGFGVSASTAGAPAVTSDLVVRSRGTVDGVPNQARITARMELSGVMPAEFKAYADFSGISSGRVAVRLLGENSNTLATASFFNSLGTPLVRLEALPDEVETDATVTIANLPARAAVVLRYESPVSVTILDEAEVPVAKVKEVQFMVTPTVELGLMRSVTITAGDFRSVTIDRMFAGRFGLDRWSATRAALASTDTGPTDPVCITDSSPFTPGGAKAMAQTSKRVAQVWVDLQRVGGFSGLASGSYLHFRFCGTPMESGRPIDVDPLEFPVQNASGTDARADINVPFCLTGVCPPNPMVHIDFMPDHGFDATRPATWPCQSPCMVGTFTAPLAGSSGVVSPSVGTINDFPVRVTEELTSGGVPCVVYEYSSPTPNLDVQFDPLQCPGCRFTNLRSLAVRIRPADEDSVTRYESLFAVKLETKGLPPIKVTGGGQQFIALRPLADFNMDGTVNSQDFFDFLGAFFSGGGDVNADGLVNSQDFFDFVTCYFGGC